MTGTIPHRVPVTPANPRLVVVVDDDPIFREFARELLELLGWVVMEFPDGVRFLRWMEDRAVEPHFVVLDLKMPGMDGPDVLRRLVATAPDLPVMLCTGLERWQVDAELFALGRVGWLPKPLAASDITAAVTAANAYAAVPGAVS